MAVKNTFSAEIGDGFDKFKEFSKLFDKYRDALGKTPSAFASISKENKKQEDSLKSMTAAIIAQLEVMTKEERVQQRMEESTKRTAIHWHDIQTRARSFWGTITSAAATLRNNTVIAGLLGAGGLWGLDRLGSAAGSYRRQSTGLGTSYGEMSAFGLTYNRTIDASGLLSAVSQGRGNIGGPESTALMSLGVNPFQGSPTDVARKTIDRIRSLAKSMPEALLGPVLGEGYGASSLGVSIEDMRRLRNMNDKEYEQYNKQFGNRTNQLGIDEQTLKKWQDFTNTLDTTGKRIEGSLIRGLADATGPLEKLSDAAASLIDKFVSSKGFEFVINQLTSGLETFARYMGTEQFKTDVETIGVAFKKIAEWALTLTKFIAGSGPQANGGIISIKPNSPADQAIKGAGSLWNWSKDQYNKLVVPRLPDGTAIVDQYPSGFNPSISAGSNVSTNGTLAGLMDLVAKLEGSPDRNGVPQVSPAGAIGKWQIMPSTAAGYGVTAEQLRDPAINKSVAERLLGDLSKRYNGDTAQILAAYNAGPMIGDYLRDHGNRSLPSKRPDTGGDWDYRQTQAYLARAGFNVTIDNRANADITTQSNQLGPSVTGVTP